MNNDLNDLLGRISDLNQKLADLIRTDQQYSNNPERDKQERIYALLSAYIAYREAAYANSIGSFLNDQFEILTARSNISRKELLEKTIKTAILLDIYYQDIAEHTLARQYLTYAEEHVSPYTKSAIKYAMRYVTVKS